MMKFIKIDFPIELFFPEETRTNSFYDDILPEEVIEAQGYFQPPMFPSKEDTQLISGEKEKMRKLTNNSVKKV